MIFSSKSELAFHTRQANKLNCSSGQHDAHFGAKKMKIIFLRLNRSPSPRYITALAEEFAVCVVYRGTDNVRCELRAYKCPIAEQKVADVQ